MPETLEFAAQLARETGQVLLDFYQKASTRSHYKDDHTLLTEADLAADRYLTEKILAHYPDDHILSEEMDKSYPADGRPTWIIDPLDGTTNFSRGVHYWGISIARIVGGTPEIGVLYLPVINELFTARHGAGAELNGQKLTVPAPEQLNVHFLACDSRYTRKYRVTGSIKPRILGSAAYNFCGIAKGAFLGGIESIPKIWDIAASWLVLSEAGGAVRALEHEPFPLTPGLSYEKLRFPVIGAVSAEALDRITQQIIYPIKE